VVVIFAGTRGYLDPLPVAAVSKFEQSLLRHLRESHADILGDIAARKEITSDTEKRLVGALDAFAKNFTA
jgi:F-type H+-transporting ATPase subunit alpha